MNDANVPVFIAISIGVVLIIVAIFLKRSSKPKTGSASRKNVNLDGLLGQSSAGGDEVEELLRMLESMPERRGPKRPQVYMFQHISLPAAAFQNHPELIRDLAGGRSHWPLLHMWSLARVQCEDSGMLPEGSDSEEAMDADGELFEAVSIRPHRRNGYTAYIISMPAPEEAPEAHFAAIVHKDDEPHVYMQPSPSTRYFTLEKTVGSNPPVFCEWTRDGSHGNFGAGPTPNEASFAEAVFSNVFSRA